MLVHVEGKRPALVKTVRGGITKGWVKVTLAGLLNPALFEGPYHQLADAAGVTPPTVMTCLRDLQRRGLLNARWRRRRLIGRQELLPLWTQAYVNTLRPRLAERRFRMLTPDGPRAGLQRLEKVLNAHGIAWCLTGAAAALQLTHLLVAVADAKAFRRGERTKSSAKARLPASRGPRKDAKATASPAARD